MIIARYDPMDLIRQPIRLRSIGLSLLAALWLNLLPWDTLSVPLAPDFLLLALLFWALYQPQWIGLGSAFLCGVLVDVANGTLLGQHALAYAVSVGVALIFARRILSFGPWRQAVHVVGLLGLMQGVLWLSSRLAAPGALGRDDFLPVLIGGLLWPVMLALLQRSVRRTTGF